MTILEVALMTPAPRGVMFFTDKDLSDILKEVWPDDDRIFVTEVYSIENYFVSSDVLRSLCTEFVQVRGASVDLSVIFNQFEVEYARFCQTMRVVMAWILVAKALNLKPNLQDLRFDHFCSISHNCKLSVRRARAQLLATNTGMARSAITLRQILAAARRLRMYEPKCYLRGKFELQFQIKFLKQALVELRSIVEEIQGRLVLTTPIEQSNFIQILSPRISTPATLATFLSRHIQSQ